MISILKIIVVAYVAIAIYGKGIEDGKAKFCQQSPTPNTETMNLK